MATAIAAAEEKMARYFGADDARGFDGRACKAPLTDLAPARSIFAIARGGSDGSASAPTEISGGVKSSIFVGGDRRLMPKKCFSAARRPPLLPLWCGAVATWLLLLCRASESRGDMEELCAAREDGTAVYSATTDATEEVDDVQPDESMEELDGSTPASVYSIATCSKEALAKTGGQKAASSASSTSTFTVW